MKNKKNIFWFVQITTHEINLSRSWQDQGATFDTPQALMGNTFFKAQRQTTHLQFHLTEMNHFPDLLSK